MKLRALLPGGVRRTLRWVSLWPEYRRITADPTSYRLLRQLTRAGERGRTERLSVRALPHAITVRSGTTDASVVWAVLTGSTHLPLHTTPESIWDLGANIGIAAADLHNRFPRARVVALEPDPENARLARLNAPGCVIVEAAAWTDTGPLRFESIASRETGAKVSEQGTLEVQGISLNDLADREGKPDFVKMDVEGAERHLLAGECRWAEGVREIRVECHGGYTPSACAGDLERLGFSAEVRQERLARTTVVGVKRPLEA